MKNYTLECCVDSVESAVAAAENGATRLELCTGLVVGGLSPTPALFREVRRRVSIPIHVLLRPRFGDFLYTDAEFAVLREEVRMYRDEGADGLVLGLLTPDGAIDEPRMAALIEQAGGLRVTLHRAFDLCADPFAALEAARRLGVRTILTSGQQNACREGAPLLRKLLEAADDSPEILIGSGVDAAAITAFRGFPNARHFHLSGKVVVESGMQRRNPAVSMGAANLDEYAIWRTSPEAVRAAARALRENLTACGET